MIKIEGSESGSIRGMDPRIWIHTKMTWIRNTEWWYGTLMSFTPTLDGRVPDRISNSVVPSWLKEKRPSRDEFASGEFFTDLLSKN